MKINKQLNINVSTKNFNISEDQDEITLEGYASKMYENGKEVVDLDSEFVATKGFELLATRLLLNHNLEEPCGHIELEHKPDGIYLRGKAYKDTMSDKEWARLKKGLYSFSIGFTVEDGEYRTIDGDEILTFTKGIVYEVSLVAVASNPKATIDTMKSVKQADNTMGLQCSVEQIKSMNPNIDCSCLAELKEQTKGKDMTKEEQETQIKNIQEKITKGLTIEETMNESWNVDDNLWQMFSYFIQTIEENIYEFKWSESFDKQEMITNINSAMETFKQTIEVEATRIGETIGKQIEEGKTKDMDKEDKQTKSVETEEVKKETIETKQEETKAEEVQEQNSEMESQEEVSSKENQKQEPKEDLAKTSDEEIKEESKDEPKTVEPETTETKTESQEEVKEETKQEPAPKLTALDIKLEEASADEIKEAYDTLANKLEQIEAYVTAELEKTEQ